MSACLVQQRRGLQRGLPGTEHHDLLAVEDGQVHVRAGVRADVGGQADQLTGQPGEVLDAGRDDHPAGPGPLPGVQGQLEAAGLGTDAGDHGLLRVPYEAFGEPLAVADEGVQ